jgi:putative SOS response-associated peptidase YedK
VCGRYSLATPTADDLRRRFPIGESVEIERRFNIAPGDDVLAVVTHKGATEGALLRWGLVPSWAKDAAVGYNMINARAETVAERPAYRDAFRRSRCLVIADGFYEWQAQPGRGKQPFHATRADGEPFAFAGLRSWWRDEDGQEIESCAIVTTAANALLAPIHNRMPVMLERADEQDWLDPDTPLPHLHALLHPLPEPETAIRAVSRAVNDARYDGPECLADAEPETPPAQANLF